MFKWYNAIQLSLSTSCIHTMLCNIFFPLLAFLITHIYFNSLLSFKSAATAKFQALVLSSVGANHWSSHFLFSYSFFPSSLLGMLLRWTITLQLSLSPGEKFQKGWQSDKQKAQKLGQSKEQVKQATKG